MNCESRLLSVSLNVMRRLFAFALVTLIALPLSGRAPRAFGQADETSSQDKLRILYSNGFTFTADGLPLVTVELMSNQPQVRLGGDDAVVVLPDGDGGAVVDAGPGLWTLTVERPTLGVIREWTVVAQVPSGAGAEMRTQMALWKDRGFAPRGFEVGTVFGVEGTVFDSRKTLVSIAPEKPPLGRRQADALAKKYAIETSVYRELVERPKGMVVARHASGAVVRNPSVIWFAPKNAEATLTVLDVEHGGGGSQLGPVKKETRQYYGRVYVTVGNDGQLVAVNAVDAERLLEGLVPSEIYANSHEEALKTQAVAARTALLSSLGMRHQAEPFLVCSTQQCQVYSGAGKANPRTTKAVRNTRGQVLFRGDGRLVDARYSANSGGISENNEYIWGGAPDPALRGRLDALAQKQAAWKPFTNGVNEANVDAFLRLPAQGAYAGRTGIGAKQMRWQQTVPQADMDRFVAEAYPQVGSVRKIEPLDRGFSGRVGSAKLTGTKGQAVAKGELHIRRMFGGLRSALFVVKPTGDPKAPVGFEFTGAGFGHGVGMCQSGAMGMAEAGISYKDILAHYYTGSSVRRLY